MLKLKTKSLWLLLAFLTLFCCTFNVHASRSTYNTYLSHRVATFARTRANEHCPGITYNTRDFGNLRADDGKYRIKQYKLFRSANLHSLNRYGANELNRLGIRHDIDLRAMNGPNVSISQRPQPGEFNLMPNRYHIKMYYKNYPVETSEQEAETWPFRKRLGEKYRFNYWYTLSPTARKAYHKSIMELIKNGKHNTATMINCTQGRDRTGVLSAIIENILGVNKYTIYNDFLLTNYYRYQTPYSDQIIRLNNFYRNVYFHYHSMWNYLIHGLYLSRSDLNSMRREYLERN